MLLRGAWSCCNYHVLMTFTKSTDQSTPFVDERDEKRSENKDLEDDNICGDDGDDNDDYAKGSLLF